MTRNVLLKGVRMAIEPVMLVMIIQIVLAMMVPVPQAYVMEEMTTVNPVLMVAQAVPVYVHVSEGLDMALLVLSIATALVLTAPAAHLKGHVSFLGTTSAFQPNVLAGLMLVKIAALRHSRRRVWIIWGVILAILA